MSKTQSVLHECCVVPYRVTPYGAEFCLLTPQAQNRWEFPKIRIAGEHPDQELLRQAATAAGLYGDVSDEQLGSFVASRKNETKSMVAFLMRVDDIDEEFPQLESHRRLWCLPEEARVRIRRKPLRRFIDLALQGLREKPRQPR